ncbi:hypothetical protein M3194_21465 [Paenibacillus glycanilyticus]|uniref:hypothetical protein n=1 Tax=Paenibacillus glycanilyticus TaxID=126569 RepID=UPI0020412929|nr:hypothetical protein [Paenibacillus glycanilyticus]MCM3629906.1 hypothetical protein [Paenibacillus glycanilyticus]
MDNRGHVLWLGTAILFGILGGAGTILCILWIAVGTLFFDDPSLTYGGFLLHVGKYSIVPILLVVIAGYSVYRYSQAKKNK